MEEVSELLVHYVYSGTIAMTVHVHLDVYTVLEHCVITLPSNTWLSAIISQIALEFM